MGFLAIDLAKALNLPLHDPNDKNARVADNAHPKAGNGVLGKDPAKPDVVVATNGGSDLIYIPGKDRKLADRTIKALLEQDYVSGIFVDDEFGNFPGTLPMSQLGLKGKAVDAAPLDRGQFPLLVVRCEEPTNCSVQVADTVLRQGQGMHGSFSRGDTLNFTAAIGPDFKSGYVDPFPVSNADVGATAAKLLGLTQKVQGQADRPRHDGSDAQWRNAAGLCRHRDVEAGGERPAHRAQLPARRLATLFRRGRFSGPHARAGSKRRKTENGGEIAPPHVSDYPICP